MARTKLIDRSQLEQNAYKCIPRRADIQRALWAADLTGSQSNINAESTWPKMGAGGLISQRV